MFRGVPVCGVLFGTGLFKCTAVFPVVVPSYLHGFGVCGLWRGCV